MKTKLTAQAFTLIEIVIVIVIIAIMAVIAVPRFINMRNDAINAAAEGNLAALRSVIASYYSNSAAHNELCTTDNPYRSSDETAPCFPSGTSELESLLSTETSWFGGGGGQCYNANTGAIITCP